MTSNEIRKKFLNFFESRGHRIVRSASLVPRNDPTLLFTNAGMVQFKRTFLDEEKRGYRTAATSQKCVRAGGKHNDLENVGHTARHHTFFEMLGNFSFGDYFKKEAIAFAWELLTEGYGLDADKLWASVFEKDDEAEALWISETGIPAERIVRLGEADNFWSMGDSGPCGPCSEVYIDRGEAFGCQRPGCSAGCDCDRYLELWNLVFMQFNRSPSGEMTPLPKPSIDTGLGLERLASILQNADTNFETDLIFPIIQKTEEISGAKAGDSPGAGVAMKVIADHSRAAAFLIGDGVLPSNEGRGYVLRRIMRRAIRYGRDIGLEEPFLHQTASTVFDIMGESYPELKDSREFITKVIENEEKRFNETLDHGLGLLQETLAALESRGESRLPGEVVFKLYDTYGFPVDIVRDVARDKKIEVDFEGFEAAMSVQREKSRSRAVFTGGAGAFSSLETRPVFKGYEALSWESEIIAVSEDAGEVEVATKETPFYGESGGQEGDTGIIAGKNFHIRVERTWKDPSDVIIHRGLLTAGEVRKGDAATLTVDGDRRAGIARNHTATHLLHSVLRAVLGDHVKQAGSRVGHDRLRFDFSHFSKVSRDELEEIERRMNEKIVENAPLQTREMEMDEALRSGATAIFEEKYGERVRVVSIGDFSRELCGGTHARLTGDIGLFKITGESSVASGVRRIEAVTGPGALAHVQETERVVKDMSALLKADPHEIAERVKNHLKRRKELEKENGRLKTLAASAPRGGDSIEDSIRMAGDVKTLVRQAPVDSPSALRDLADKFRDKLGSGIVVLGSEADSKAMLIAVVTRDLSDRFHAGKIIREAAGAMGGRGGGRPDMAQAGGPHPEKLGDALQRAFEVIESVATSLK
ncbi:alanyl-tRNA synthetase [Candidatus Desulfarcum epimagneticum]|uniref:Alanine--tRNA ligase n=1 Tax=uncultured Desulfobacteraceae bacterium TaxID=218296 RepID=A0A484HP57_9BACT|nr:alanyl-tRNA synthetase [uncultured Desulfobacteraceae bacterium]